MESKTFYRPTGQRDRFPAVVWNPRANAALADFSSGGTFTTSDPYVIQRLQELGYPMVEDKEDTQPPPAKVSSSPKAPAPLKKGSAPKGGLKKRGAIQSGDSMDTEEASPSKP